jgi:hypothetical protein
VKLSIYAIRDIKNEFCTPFTTANDATAKRMFVTEQKNKDSMLAQFPADFELWKLADMDTKTGQIFPNLENIAIQEGENV